jgi:hypothetical protein
MRQLKKIDIDAVISLASVHHTMDGLAVELKMNRSMVCYYLCMAKKLILVKEIIKLNRIDKEKNRINTQHLKWMQP